MTGPLARRHALVTGGGSGIGAAIARALAAEGARVSLVGRRREPLRAVAADCPGAIAITADMTCEPDVARMMNEARAAHGPVDIVIANAGAADSERLARAGLAHWNRMIAANLTSAFLTARAGLVDLAREDAAAPLRRLVFVASTAGLKGYAYVAAYCAAKHGVVGLTRALAAEYAQAPLTVNAVCPGYTDTPLLDASVATIVAKTGRPQDDARAWLAKTNPQGRLIAPEEVAAAVVWLCRPDSGSITGQALSISGGEI